MLPQGNTFTFPDGTTLDTADIVDPPRKGRKVVILGDTCNSDAISPLALGADLLIHEATNAWIREYDMHRIPSPQALERDTINHGRDLRLIL